MYTLKSSVSALVRELPSPMNLRKTGSGALERFLEWRLRPNVELETLSYHTGIRAVASSVHQEASSCVKPDINFFVRTSLCATASLATSEYREKLCRPLRSRHAN